MFYTDDRFDRLFQGNESRVVRGIDENIAIAQNERRSAGEVARQIYDPAGAVLDLLFRVFDSDCEIEAVSKKFADHVAAITNDDEELLNAGGGQSLDDV